MTYGQRRLRNPGSDNFSYVECAEITVIDIDLDCELADHVFGVLKNNCNLVAITRKGVHLYFAGITPELRGAQLSGVDIRSGGGKKKPDIIYTAPSTFEERGYGYTPLYKWIALPAMVNGDPDSAKLLPLPDELRKILVDARTRNKRQHTVGEALDIDNIPETYPFSITLNGKTFAATCLSQAAKEALNTLQLSELEREKQPSVWRDAMHIDHALSAITAGKQSGVHFFSPMEKSHMEADTLIKLRLGAILKTDRLPICEFPGCRNREADVQHIMGHIGQGTIDYVLDRCVSILSPHEAKLAFPEEIPYPMWLGFVNGTMIKWKNRDIHTSELTESLLQRMACIFAETGIETFHRCVPTHPLAPKKNKEQMPRSLCQ